VYAVWRHRYCGEHVPLAWSIAFELALQAVSPYVGYTGPAEDSTTAGRLDGKTGPMAAVVALSFDFDSFPPLYQSLAPPARLAKAEGDHRASRGQDSVSDRAPRGSLTSIVAGDR